MTVSVVTCSQQHQYALAGINHAQQAIDDQCPDCHAGDPLLFLDLLNTSFLAYTRCVDELFENGGRLQPLYAYISGLNAHNLAELQYAFERRPAPSRQGTVLAFLSQALLNEGLAAGADDIRDAGYTPNLVVVIGLAMVTGTPTFFIGVNGHDNIYDAAEAFTNAMPNTIFGIPCVHVFEKDPHESALDRLPPSVSSWSWHGEQKVLKTIKEWGIDPRLSTTCLGIGHRLGPCSPGTTTNGSHGCYHYLERKYQRDEARLQIGGNATVTVSAYWYAHPARLGYFTITTCNL